MSGKHLNKICAASVAVLFLLLVIMYMHERSQRAARIEENRQMAARIEAEAAQRGEVVEEIYVSLAEALAKGPSGFVCWGDEEMDGNRNGTLPAALDRKIEETWYVPLR